MDDRVARALAWDRRFVCFADRLGDLRGRHRRGDGAAFDRRRFGVGIERRAGQPDDADEQDRGECAGGDPAPLWDRLRPPALRAQPLPQPPQRALADRLLDVAPGERRDPEGRADLEHVAHEAAAVHAARRGEDDDREVPEVDAVGAHADPAQRLPAEQHARAGSPGGRAPRPAPPSRPRAGPARRGR